MNADLNWILNSPTLMLPPAGITGWKSLFQQLNIREVPPRHSASPGNKRLGIYYEDLIYEILTKSQENIKLERNIQVKQHKITQGEFDFICHSPRFNFHLECAVKFYLRVGSGQELNHYIGPGKKDRLDIKWNRLLDHQLPLSDTDAGREVLAKLGVSTPKKALLLQGYLFHPLADSDVSNLAAGINPEHLKGWWVRPSQIELLDRHSHYAVMEKPYWLTPRIDKAFDFKQLRLLGDKCRFPLLISRGDWNEGQWIEADRGFLVPEDW